MKRSVDQQVYKNESLVERFFSAVQQLRRVSSRYDKLAECFASFVALAAAFIWLT